MKRQGWELKHDGAQRAASRMVKSAYSGIGVPVKALGDHRCRNRGSIG
jgi:hypothetical protein